MVRHLGRHINSARLPVKGVQVFRKAFPVIGYTLFKGGARDFLNRLHQVDKFAMMRLAYWSESDATIAE